MTSCFHLIRHCHIHSTHMEQAHNIQSSLHILLLHIKCHISIIQTQSLKTIIIHQRRCGMSHWGTNQRQKPRMSRNSFFHKYLPLNILQQFQRSSNHNTRLMIQEKLLITESPGYRNATHFGIFSSLNIHIRISNVNCMLFIHTKKL